jgi:integrase/recombinase XerD
MIMPKALWSKCLPIALWPPADRAAWDAGMRPSNPFDGEGVVARWSAATRRKTAKGYGRFLCWLNDRGELDDAASPAARITRERLNGYLNDLKRTNRGHTIQCRIQELGEAMQALVPDSDWRFIKHAATRLRATTVPARDKRGRLPPITEVIEQGNRMMERAEEPGALSELGRAALYRDGLLIAFLAYHPLRLRNVSSLRIGHDLIVQDDRFVVQIDASETKTRQRIHQELSPNLSSAMKRYIDRYRPVLLEARGRWHAPAADELWISRDGSPCRAETFRNIIRKHTAGPNGCPLSPHLFRSMAATSVAIEAPDAVELIPAILAHRAYRTSEEYYNLAGSLDASRNFSGALDDIRKDLEAALYSQPRSPKASRRHRAMRAALRAGLNRRRPEGQ